MQPGDTGTNALAAREFLPFHQDDQLNSGHIEPGSFKSA